MKQLAKIIGYASIILLNACSNGGSFFGMSNISGKTGELLIVIDDEYKNTSVGEKVLEIFTQQEVGLTQAESSFSILLISKNHFSSTFRTHRNILFLEVDKKHTDTLNFKKNVWVRQQNFVSARAKSADNLLALLEKKEQPIVDFYIDAEIERFKSAYSSHPNMKVKKSVQSHLGIEINMPEGYEINKIDEGFMWISLESEEHSQGIILYERPYKDTLQLEKWKLLEQRDKITQAHIPGPSKGSYMTTEYIIPIQHKIGRYIQNAYTVELRGKWRVEHDFMGGPFVSYSFVDTTKNRLITIEGYVYYPNKNKRNLIRQLQAICQSARCVH